MKVVSSKFKQIMAVILIVCLVCANNSFYLFASSTEFPTMESKDVSDYREDVESEDSKLNNEDLNDENESREDLDASKPAGSHSGDNNSSVGESDNSRMGELSEPSSRNVASASDLDDDIDSEESKDIDTDEELEDELGIASASEADETEGSLTLPELEDELGIASTSEADDKKGSNNSPLQEDELGIASASEADENKDVASASEIEKLASPSEIEVEIEIATDSEINIDIASDSELKLNNKLGLFGAEHTHKICGATAGGSCLHTLGATHDATFDYTYEAFFNGATLTEDEIKIKLENSTTYYYLDQDISFSALTQLTINNVLVLCLNGKNINNVYFSGADIIITNCTNTTSKITNPSDNYRLFNGNTYVYGMHNNINLNTDSLLEAVANGVALLFDVAVTSPDNTRNLNRSAVGPANDLNIVFESVNVKSLSRMYAFFNLNGRDNVTVSIKNCTFDDLKSNISTILFMNDAHQGSTLNFYGNNTFKNIEVGFNEYEATNRIEAIITIRRSDMVVQDGTTTIENCISQGRSIVLESFYDEANIEIKEGANLVINNNQIYMQNVTTGAMYINQNFKIYGNLSVTNNKIINSGTINTSKAAGIIFADACRVTVGNTKFIVEGNTSDGNETTYPGQHMYQVHSAVTNGFLTQEAGTEMSIDSRMMVGFQNGAAGTIINDWSHSDPKAFDTIFKADKFADEEFMIVRDQNKAVRVISHGHKICGHSSTDECNHRGIATHSEIFSFVAFFGNSTLTETEIIQKLTNGGSYRLDKDLELANPTNVSITADLHLCLNGKSMKNVVFEQTGVNNNRLSITNCKNQVATITRQTGDAYFITNYSNVSVIAPYKNISAINSNRIRYSITGTSAKLDLFGVTFTQNPRGDIQNSLITYNSPGSEINISNVNISNFDANGNFGIIHMIGSNTNKLAVNIYESKFEGNTHRDAYSEQKAIIYANHCDTGIYDTDIVNNKGGIAFCNNGSGTSYLKNVNMTGNTGICWIVNLNRTTNDFDNVNVSNNTWATGYGGSVVDVKQNAVLNVKSGGLKINGNTQDIETPTCLYVATGGRLNVEEGASLEIKENKLKYYTPPTHDVFTIFPGALDYGYNISILGNLYIEDNKIVGATSPATKQFAAVYVRNGDTMTVGNGTIRVQNNFIYSDADGTVRADETASEYYHMYQVLTANTNGMFTQETGTEMSTDSRVEVAFSASPYMGVFFDSWAHSDKNAFKTIFSADKYRDDEFSVVKDENNKLRIMAHGHKICGHASDEDCNHRGIATHSEVYSYTALFGSTTMDDAQIVAKLTAGGNYRLDKEINLNTPTAITLTADLRLCLNGFDLKGVSFNAANHKLNITNCKDVETTIQHGTDSQNLLFHNVHVSVMSPKKNINVVSNVPIRIDGAANTYNADFYNVVFTPCGTSTIRGTIVLGQSANNNSAINLSKAVVKDFVVDYPGSGSIEGNILCSRNGTLNMYDFSFTNNDSYYSLIRVTTGGAMNVYSSEFVSNFSNRRYGNLIFLEENNTKCAFYEKNLIKDNIVYGDILQGSTTTRKFDIEGVLDIVNNSFNGYGGTGDYSRLPALHLGALTMRNATLNVKNNKDLTAGGHGLLRLTGDLNLYNSHLVIEGNTFNRSTLATQGIFNQTTGNTYLYESSTIKIINNNIGTTGYSGTSAGLSGMYIHVNHTINISTGSIVVKGNKAVGDNASLDSNYVYQVYSAQTNNSTPFMVQLPGGKFDYQNTDMEVAFASPYIGVIMENWNDSSPYTCFTANKKNDEDLKVSKDENNKIRIMTHGHKICGYTAEETCDHRGIATHSEVYSYFSFFGNSTMTDAQIVTKLAAGGIYKLDKDLELANPANIDLTANLFICLNGHTLKNVYFSSAANSDHKIYITNCKNVAVTISRSDDETEFVTNYSDVLVIAPHKNITMNNAVRYTYGLTTNAAKYNVYGVTYKIETSHISNSLVASVGPGSEINLSSINVSNLETLPSTGYSIVHLTGTGPNTIAISIYDSVFDKNKTNALGETASMIYTTHCDLRVYDTKFTNNNVSTIMSNRTSGYATLKNVNITNNTLYGQVLSMITTTNYFDNVDMSNNVWGNGVNCALIEVKSSAILNIQGGGMKANDNTQRSAHDVCFYVTEGTLNVEENATLEIKRNKCRAAGSTTNPHSILPGKNYDCVLNILGNLYIEDNKFVSVAASIIQNYAALYIKNGNVLNVGNGTIVVRNNFAYTDADGNVRADETVSGRFHVFQTMFGGTANSMTQEAGTEMSKDSRMVVVFANSPHTGTFFMNWKHSDMLIYNTIFTADKFLNNDLTVNLNLNGHLEIVNGGHLHKPCGIEKAAACSHRGIDDHNYGIPYLPFSNGIDMTNNDQIRNRLAGGGYYYLDQELAPTANQSVTLTADLYLCLNGHNMSNVCFNSSGFKVFITNCSNNEVEIRQESTEMFRTLSVHMVAGKGRINVKANGFYYVRENGSRTINSTFYNILSIAHGGTSSLQLFHVSDTTDLGSSYVVSNCEFMNHVKAVAPTTEIARPAMLFKRSKGRIYDCKFTNISTINSSFLVYEGSDIEYKNCVFDRIFTGGPSSGTGSLFRLDSVYHEIDMSFTLEDITVLKCEMYRSFVEVNDDARATVTINDSFVANDNNVNKNGGTNFFNTKTLNLTDAKLELKNNTSNNAGLAGLVLAQNSIKLYNSHIDISENTIKRNNTGAQALLKINNGDILVASNSYIVIKDNKINTEGVTGNNANLSALYLDAGQTISIEGGTSYIDISGNVPIGANKDLAGNHMYQIYMNKTSATTEELFKTRNNGYLDVSKSYAEFALPSGTPAGALFDTWNATNVKNWHADVHKNHFTASNFGAERKNLVVVHYKHKLMLTEKETYIDSQKAYIDKDGDPCVATVPEALRRDADGNKFIWWFPTEIRDAYGNIINDARNFTLNEQYRPIMELSKWTAAADDKTRTAWDFKPIYATTYTVYLDSRYTARTVTNSYFYQFTAKRGDPVTLKDYFPSLDDSRFKFLNYNTDYNGNGKTFTLGLYSRGLLASDNPSINLYGFYSFGGGGGGRSGGGGSGGGGGELQKTGSGSYQYVTAIYETHSHIADLTPLTVAWQKWEHTYVAYAIFQYDDRGYPTSYVQLRDGFYLIRWNGVDHVYGFDKAGNMLTGYVECGGHKYIMAPDGEFEGSMLKSNAFVFGGSYMIAEDGIVNQNNSYIANHFVYDMDLGRYKYINYMADSQTPVFVNNELRNITHRGLTAKYLFNRDGFMMTGLTGYKNNIYYFNEFGPYIGSAYTGTVYAGGGHATFNSEGELIYDGDKGDIARGGIPVQSASLSQ